MSLRKLTIFALFVGFACATSSCKGPEPAKEDVAPAAAPTPAPEPKAKVSDPKQIFETRCAVCHGTTGAGDGPGAQAITPKPRAFADATWQESVTDEAIIKIISEGGPAVGKSPGMPAQTDLKDNQEVLKGLVAIIRGYKK